MINSKMKSAFVSWFNSWLLWQDAKIWVKDVHPSWEYLATQTKRPELQEEYRAKIIREYLAAEHRATLEENYI